MDDNTQSQEFFNRIRQILPFNFKLRHYLKKRNLLRKAFTISPLDGCPTPVTIRLPAPSRTNCPKVIEPLCGASIIGVMNCGNTSNTSEDFAAALQERYQRLSLLTLDLAQEEGEAVLYAKAYGASTRNAAFVDKEAGPKREGAQLNVSAPSRSGFLERRIAAMSRAVWMHKTIERLRRGGDTVKQFVSRGTHDVITRTRTISAGKIYKEAPYDSLDMAPHFFQQEARISQATPINHGMAVESAPTIVDSSEKTSVDRPVSAMPCTDKTANITHCHTLRGECDAAAETDLRGAQHAHRESVRAPP